MAAGVGCVPFSLDNFPFHEMGFYLPSECRYKSQRSRKTLIRHYNGYSYYFYMSFLIPLPISDRGVLLPSGFHRMYMPSSANISLSVSELLTYIYIYNTIVNP